MKEWNRDDHIRMAVYWEEGYFGIVVSIENPILHKWDTVNWDARLAEESKKLMDCEVRLRCLGVVQENGSVYMTNYNIFRFLQSVYQPYGERDPYIENYYYMGCQNRLNHMISLRTYGSLKGQEHTLESDQVALMELKRKLYMNREQTLGAPVLRTGRSQVRQMELQILHHEDNTAELSPTEVMRRIEVSLSAGSESRKDSHCACV